MKISVVVPVYNEQIENVPVCSAASACEREIEVLVCDNSTDASIVEMNRLCSAKQGFSYIDMHGNHGIAVAYNQAISIASGEIICIFDDDTYVTADYFSRVANAVCAQGPGIYLPCILSCGKLLSPLNHVGPAIFRYKSIESINLKTACAFNTGLVITRDVFDRVSYRENLFLEWIDHAFCIDAHREGIPFHFLRDIKLEQNYSRDTNSLDSALFRQKIARKDLKEFYSAGIVNRAYRCCYAIYRVVRLTIKYRTAKFIFQG